MTIDLQLPKKEELDKAKNIAIGTIGGIIAVKVISAADGTDTSRCPCRFSVIGQIAPCIGFSETNSERAMGK